MENPPTCGQLERSLSQRIQALYREQLGHRLGKVTCQLFESKIAIVIENSITQPEQVLAQEGKSSLAQEVHSCLDGLIQPQLRSLLEDVLKVNVLDLLSDAAFETGRTGIIAILANTPLVRNPTCIPKTKLAD